MKLIASEMSTFVDYSEDSLYFSLCDYLGQTNAYYCFWPNFFNVIKQSVYDNLVILLREEITQRYNFKRK